MPIAGFLQLFLGCFLRRDGFVLSFPVRNAPAPLRSFRSACQLHAWQVNIRDWQPGDGPFIRNILQAAEDNEKATFNPEGVLDLDCTTESLLKESYNVDDDCCFLVAELLVDNDNGNNDNASFASSATSSTLLVGTAGLIVGTRIQYQVSGSSLSTPNVLTAAVRRCAVCLPADVQLGVSDSVSKQVSVDADAILKQLLMTMEERARNANVNQLLALAYPKTSGSVQQSTTMAATTQKPSPQLYETLGYTRLAQQLPGVTAIQYGKNLFPTTTSSTTRISIMDNIDSFASSDSKNADAKGIPSTALVSSLAVVGLAVSVLLGAWFGVAQFMGLDMTMPQGNFAAVNDRAPASSMEMNPANNININNNINRGLGRPLSREDLRQLLQDEQLKRTTIDPMNEKREWDDLSLEERREEMALLQVIQGQDIRIVR